MQVVLVLHRLRRGLRLLRCHRRSGGAGVPPCGGAGAGVVPGGTVDVVALPLMVAEEVDVEVVAVA